jgi:hypothetical protein
MLKKSALCAALILTTPMLAHADPVGTFQVEGKNPNGSSYNGIVRVVQTGKTYTMAWKIGDVKMAGVGIGGVNGKDGITSEPATKNVNVLTVAFSAGTGFGAAQFVQQGDGSWLGTWAPLGSGEIAYERWVPQSF